MIILQYALIVAFDKVLESDMLILAIPIYSWYCTPPMKAFIDRLVYGMNKYYGDEKGPWPQAMYLISKAKGVFLINSKANVDGICCKVIFFISVLTISVI